jgi:striatin 1/3/4
VSSEPILTQGYHTGVMRFLQIEWHNHERARNAWDIERAEMKAKIAKQEGEGRQAKRLNEQLDRQVRMLEMALRNERAKSKGGKVDEKKGAELEKEKKNSNGENKGMKSPRRTHVLSLRDSKRPRNADFIRTAVKPHNSFLQTDDDPDGEKERERYLDSTTKYLKNCMKEIQYLLTPPQHPPPPQVLPNGNYTGLPEAPLSVEEYYARQNQQQQQLQLQQQQHQQQQQQQQMHPNALAFSQPTAAPNHLPPPVPNSLPQAFNQQDTTQREFQHQDYQNATQPAQESQQQAAQPEGTFEGSATNVTHSFHGLASRKSSSRWMRTAGPLTKSRRRKWSIRRQVYRLGDPTPISSQALLVTLNCLQNLRLGLVQHRIEGKAQVQHQCREGGARRARPRHMMAPTRIKTPIRLSSRSNLR